MSKATTYINQNPKWVGTTEKVIASSTEAKICLNCPYPECTKSGICDYYIKEHAKIKEREKAITKQRNKKKSRRRYNYAT